MKAVAYRILLLLGFALLLLWAGLLDVNAQQTGPAQGCAAGEPPCRIDGGRYSVRLPEGIAPGADQADPIGAIIFFHGWQGTAERTMSNDFLTGLADRLNVAFVVPDGERKTWSFPSSPTTHRDEVAFVSALLDDLPRRFPIDPDRIMVTGFSMGGSMSWTVACELGSRVAAAAPIAGAFWEPLPNGACPDPVPVLLHVHGLTDTVVPMEGRPIGRRSHQGDVGESFAVMADRAGCASPATAEALVGDAPYAEYGLSCSRTGCGERGALELCTHPGGHSVRAEWIDRAWRETSALYGWSGR